MTKEELNEIEARGVLASEEIYMGLIVTEAIEDIPALIAEVRRLQDTVIFVAEHGRVCATDNGCGECHGCRSWELFASHD